MKFPITLLFTLLLMENAVSQRSTLLIGTYTHSCESAGIYMYDFDPATERFAFLGNTENVVSPSYLTISPDKNFVYSVNEAGPDSSVSAFYLKEGASSIGFLGKQPAGGEDPCYIINDDFHVITANYSGGSISVFPKNRYGGIGEARQIVKHTGTGPDKDRQEKAHVHMVQFTPDHKYLLVNDLGTDKVYIYEYHPEAEKQVLRLKRAVSVKPGSGPRHLAWSPDGRFVYLLHELDGTLTVFRYNNGDLDKIKETSVVDPAFKGKTGAADIHVSPDGRFVYATNRGDANTITVFERADNGHLKQLQQLPTAGRSPRNFTFDKSGNYLLIANQDSSNITLFRVNRELGTLEYTGKELALCMPVCLVVME